jgi:hypothetical protein
MADFDPEDLGDPGLDDPQPGWFIAECPQCEAQLGDPHPDHPSVQHEIDLHLRNHPHHQPYVTAWAG